ncbi:LPS export ABC transporter periplasmic protein LptC [Croceicoccus sp. F390]|uniref:LPS export ABC transporter periplasmic protein LptC n=1 Tax=Croceicoccus esteveae TaxID=3075597 RepID=A0ABU2ZH79_9SPHN|nr:LPS export ABC transporter periplasmic protein LptC [Croceicoccus sp. F390]MDT0575716.1 LPS export ABC transporter periplasmic protein LptC [Croceicoccus sp. F390]
MTAQAEIMRDKRRHLAEPGGGHDRLIRILSIVLPVAILALAAAMVLAPLTPRSEISFLLDRNKVALTQNRMTVKKAMYRGLDKDARPFSLMAGSAVQRSRETARVGIDDVTARLLLSEGPAQLTARRGVYDMDRQSVMIPGTVHFEAADGYRMMARNVAIDLRDKALVGDGRVEGTVPAGSFSADRIEADLQQRTVSLIGNARLRMTPGKLKVP